MFEARAGRWGQHKGQRRHTQTRGRGTEVGEGHRGRRCSTQRPGESPQGDADAGVRDVDAVGKGAQAQCTGREGIDTEVGAQGGARARAEGRRAGVETTVTESEEGGGGRNLYLAIAEREGSWMKWTRG